jgi:rubrerythrin
VKGKKMATSIAVEIILIFSTMFIAVTIAALWFAFSASKLKHKKELQEKKLNIIDRHFNDMLRIECPYCRTIYSANRNECPNCKANTKRILFPEISTT